MAKKGSLSDWIRWEAEAEQKRKQANETKRVRELQQATGKKVADVVYNKNTGLQEVRNYTGGNTARSVQQTYDSSKDVIQQRRDMYNYTSGGLRPDKEQLKEPKAWRASRRDDGSEKAYREKIKKIPDNKLTYLERQFKYGRIGMDALEPRSDDANKDKGYLVEVDGNVARGRKTSSTRNKDGDLFIDRFDLGMSAKDADAARSFNFKDMDDVTLRNEIIKLRGSTNSDDQFKHQNLLIEQGRRQESNGMATALDNVKGSDKRNDSKTDFTQSQEDLQRKFGYAREIGQQILQPTAKTKDAQPLRDMFKRGFGIGQTTDMYNEEQEQRARYVGERSEQEFSRYASAPQNQERVGKKEQAIQKEYQRLQKEYLEQGGKMNEEAFAQYVNERGQKLQQLQVERDREMEAMRQEFKQGGGQQAIEQEYEEMTANKGPEDEGVLSTIKRYGVDAINFKLSIKQMPLVGLSKVGTAIFGGDSDKSFHSDFDREVRDNIFLRASYVATDAMTGGVFGNVQERITGEAAPFRQDSPRMTGAEELGAGIVGGLTGSLVGYGVASKAVIAGSSRAVGAKFGQEAAESYARKMSNGFLEDMFIGASLDAGFGLANQLTDQNEGIDTVQLASEVVVGTLIGGSFRGALEVPGLHARHLETKRAQQQAIETEAARQADLEVQRRERDVKEKAMTASEYETLLAQSKQAERKKQVKAEYAAKIEKVKEDAKVAMQELGVDPNLPMAVNKQALNPQLVRRLDAAVSTKSFELAPRQEQIDALYNVFGGLVDRVDTLRNADLDAAGVKVRQQVTHELVQVQQAMDDAIGTDVPLAFKYKTKPVWAESQFNLRDMYERYPDGNVPPEQLDNYMAAIKFADKMVSLKSTPEPVKVAYYQVAEQMRTNLRDFAEVKAQQELDIEAEQAARLAATLKEVGVDKSVSLIDEMRQNRESLTLQRRQADKQGTIPKEDIGTLNEWFIANTTPEQKLQIAADLDIKFNKDGSISRKQKNHTIDQLIRMYINADEAATPRPEDAEVPPALDFFDKPKRKEIGKWSFQDMNQEQIMEFKQKVEQQYRDQNRQVEMLGDFTTDEGFIPQTDQFGNPLFVEKVQKQISDTEVVEVPGDTFRVDFMDGENGKFILRKLISVANVERELDSLHYRNETALYTTEELSENLAQITAEVKRLERFVEENGIDITNPEARQIPEVKQLDKLKVKQSRRIGQIQSAQRRQSFAEDVGIQDFLVPHRNSVVMPLPKQLIEDIQAIKDERLFTDDKGNLLSVRTPDAVEKVDRTEKVGAEATEDLIQQSITGQDDVLTNAERRERKRSKETLKATKKSFDLDSMDDIDNMELRMADLKGNSGRSVRKMLANYADAMDALAQSTRASVEEKLGKSFIVKAVGEDRLRAEIARADELAASANAVRNLSKLTDEEVGALLNGGKDHAERVQARIQMFEPMMKDPALQLTETELEVYKQWLDTEGEEYLSLRQIMNSLIKLTEQHSEMFESYKQMQDRTLSVKFNMKDAENFIAALRGEIGFIVDKDNGREVMNPATQPILREYEIAYSQMETNPQAASERVNELNKMVEAQYPNAIERVNQRMTDSMATGAMGFKDIIEARDQLIIDAKDLYDETFQTVVENGADAKKLQEALKPWFPQNAIDKVKVQRFPNDTIEKLYTDELADEMTAKYGDDPILEDMLDFIEELKFYDAEYLQSFDERFLDLKKRKDNAKRDDNKANAAPTELDELIARNVELYTEARAAARREQIEVSEWEDILKDKAVYTRLSQSFKYNVHDPAYKGSIPRSMWSKNANGASTIRDVAQYIVDNNIDAPGVRESLNGDQFDPQATVAFLARLDERKNYKRKDVVKESEYVRAVRTALIEEMGLKFPSIDELSSADMDTIIKVQRMLEEQAARIDRKLKDEPELAAYNAIKKAGLLEGQEIETIEYVRRVVQKTVTQDVAIPFREVSKFLPARYADVEAAASRLNAEPDEVVQALHDYVPLRQALDDLDARIGQADMDILEAVSNEVDFFGQKVEFRPALTDAELADIIDYRRVLASSTLEDKKLPVKSDVRNIIEEYLEADSKEWTATKYIDPDNPSAAKMKELEELERQGTDERIAQLKEQKLRELEAIKNEELAARAALKEYGNVSPIEKWEATARPDGSTTTQDLRQLHSAHLVENNGVKQLLPDYTVRIRQYLFSKFARISTWDRSLEAAGHKLTPGTRLLDRFEQIGGRTKARFEQKFDENYMPIFNYLRQFNLSPDDVDKLYKDMANWANLKWNDDVRIQGTDDPLIRVIPYSADADGTVLAPKDANEWYESNIKPWQDQGVDIDELMRLTKVATNDQLDRMRDAGFISQQQYTDMQRKARYGYIPLVPNGKNIDLSPYREELDVDREYTQVDQEALAGAQSPLQVLIAREHRLAGREEVNRVSNLLHDHVTRLSKAGYDLKEHVRIYDPKAKDNGKWGQVLVAYNKDGDHVKYQLSKDYDIMFSYGFENMGAIEKVLLNVSRFDASLMTSRNPVFGLKSLIRDPLTAVQVSGVQSVFMDVIPSLIEGFVGTVARKVNKPQLLDKFYASPFGKLASEANYNALDELGAVPNSVYDFFGIKPEEGTVNQTMRNLNRTGVGKAAKGFDDFMKFLSDWSEASSRLIVGRSEFRRTGDMDDAATAATSMLNFANAGTYREGANISAKTFRMMQFVNPALQGTYGYAKALKRNPVRTITAASVVLAPLAYELATRDEWSEEQQRKYAMLTDYDRANNIFFPVGDDFIKFPIPPGIESFPASFMRQIFDQQTDAVPGETRGEAAMSMASLLSNSLFPMAEANLPLIQPLIEVATNYSRFYEGEIVKEYDEKLWAKRNKDDNMSKIEEGSTLVAIKLAELTGVDSPKKIDYLIRNMPARDLTSRALDFTDQKMREMQGVDKRVSGYTPSKDSVQTGYDFLDMYFDTSPFPTLDPSKVRNAFYVGDDANINWDKAYDLYDQADIEHDLGLYPTDEMKEARNEFLEPAYKATEFRNAEKEAKANGADRHEIGKLRKEQRQYMFDFLQKSDK